MRLTFWGVRGTAAATGAAFARYGGDTMCVEIECGETRIVLDAGSGLRGLGVKLAASDAPIVANIVLSHLHLDHIMGLPHFAPLWRQDARVVIHAPREGADDAGDALLSVLRPPLFPLEAGVLPADIGVRPFQTGTAFSPGDGVTIRTFALAHNGACAGVSILWRRLKVCYVTDHEHGRPDLDLQLAAAVEGADVLIYDATFTDAEMAAHRGWGHSSWEEGLRLKQRAGVRLLALAHHHPDRTDATIDELAEAAAARSADVFFARQGLSLRLDALSA